MLRFRAAINNFSKTTWRSQQACVVHKKERREREKERERKKERERERERKKKEEKGGCKVKTIEYTS